MTTQANAALHDACAAGCDAQVKAYDCRIADVLFSLCTVAINRSLLREMTRHAQPAAL
jgi:hypothetical protein